jgi:hypothetical protein
MRIARVILFTDQIDEMSKFYGEVPGLDQVTNEKRLAGVCRGRRTGSRCILAPHRLAAKDPDGNPIQLSDR